MEFVRAGTADSARVRRDRAELQAKAGEDAAVGFVHHAVGLFQAGVVGME